MSEYLRVAEAWEVMTNFLIAGAAVATAVAAWSGLNTWKKQIVWQGDHDLARKILALFYKHRDAISSVRNPAIWTGEIERAMDKSGIETPAEADMRRFKETESVYQERWSKVSEVRSELYPLLLEADVVWGKDMRSVVEDIFSLETELLIQIRAYLRAQHPNNSQATRTAARKNMKKRRDIMYEGYDEPDAFKDDLSNSLENLEKILRKKIGRH